MLAWSHLPDPGQVVVIVRGSWKMRSALREISSLLQSRHEVGARILPL